MKPDNKFLRAVRMSWPLCGGIGGAFLGFGGLLQLPHNADSFGTIFAQGFFITTAIIGLFFGLACGVLVGGSTEKLLRHLGIPAVCAVCVATVVNALVIWQLIGIVHTRYPGLRAPDIKLLTDKSQTPITPKLQPVSPCAQPPPPENSKERAGWDAECR